MALDDTKTLVIGAGNYFTADQGTAAPADFLAPGVDWENVGHTSIEDILSLASEGGEATILKTLQNGSLRTKYSKRSETLGFVLQQFDEDSVKLYWGSNMVDDADDMLGVPDNPDPTVKAFLAVFVDGSNHFAFYAPKAEIFRNDDLSLSDTESLAGLPIGVKPLKDGSNTWTYKITPLGGTASTP